MLLHHCDLSSCPRPMRPCSPAAPASIVKLSVKVPAVYLPPRRRAAQPAARGDALLRRRPPTGAGRPVHARDYAFASQVAAAAREMDEAMVAFITYHGMFQPDNWARFASACRIPKHGRCCGSRRGGRDRASYIRAIELE